MANHQPAGKGARSFPSRYFAHRALVATGLSGAVSCLVFTRVLSEAAPGRFYPLYSLAGALLAAIVGAVFAMGAVGWFGGRANAAQRVHIARALAPLIAPAVYLLSPGPQPAIGALLLLLAGGTALSLLRPGGGRYGRLAGWFLAALTGLGALFLYLSSLMPSVLPGDSGEFQITPYVLGVPHPTGYPLWIILGKLASYLPVGSIAFRLNLLSALAGATAVLCLWLGARALGAGAAVATLSAATLGLGATLWEQSIQAEKYALNACFVALTLWLLLRWRESALKTGQHRWLWTFAFFYGLSLTHHRTMLLMAPAYGSFILLTDRRILRLRTLIPAAVLFLLPLLLYLALPVFSSRNPPVNSLMPNDRTRLLDLVLARDYQDIFFAYGWGAILPQLPTVANLIQRHFTWPGVLLALSGGAWLARRDKSAFGLLCLALLFQVGFSINYPVPNNAVYYLPAYVLIALGVAAGMEALVRVVGGAIREKRQPVLQLGLILLLSLIPLHLYQANAAGRQGPRLYRQLEVGYQYGVVGLSSVQEPAYIVSDWQAATVLWYCQHALDLGRAAEIRIAEPLEYQWQKQLQAAWDRYPIAYLSRPVVGVAASFSLSSAGPFIRVAPQPISELPNPTVSSGATFGGQVQLLGLDASVLDPLDDGRGAPRSLGASQADVPVITAGETLHLTLHWRALQQPAGDYIPHLLLVDGEGSVWVEESNRPVSGVYATNLWDTGEIVADYHRLVTDPFTPPGDYFVHLRLVPLGAKTGLQPEGGTTVGPEELELLRVRVEKPIGPPLPIQARPFRAEFGHALMLIGLDVPPSVMPGDQFQLQAYWRVREPDGQPLTATVELIDGAGEAASAQAVPVNPAGRRWAVGEIIRTQHTLNVPAQASSGFWRLRIHVVASGGNLLPVQPGWASPRATDLTVNGIRVEPLPRIATNFGNLIRLRDFRLDKETFRPGETLALTLEWQALSKIDQDYKVFVHVLHPDEWILTQQDREPVNNTYPTSQWSPGERVQDRYNLQIPSEAAPGVYRIAVGLYLPTSLSRLPIRESDGATAGDRLILKDIHVQAPP